MKSIVILYESNSSFGSEKSFGNYSAKELCESKVSELGLEVVAIPQENTVLNLLSSLCKTASEKNADYIIFSYDDLPFFNVDLTKKMINNHEEYKAEYTFADGYPYGFSPEIIDKGALEILKEIASTNHKDLGEKPVSRDGIYNVLKSEINSFEVEAVLADEDWRLFRFAFHCGKKENYLASLGLYNSIKDKNNLTVDEISEIASKNINVLKTVPGFYNIQIAEGVSNNPIYSPYCKAYEEKFGNSPENVEKFMAYDDFARLVDKIAEFSHTGVINLSLWGEALAHKDFLKMVEKVLSYKGLSVFIETDGYGLTEDFCQNLSEIVNKSEPRTNGWDKIMVAVTLDSVTPEMYKNVHKDSENGFEKALTGINQLCSKLPDSVYPQFTRMNINETELESFFRFWNEKANCSRGKFIIQKYNNYSGLLPDEKPADLSPINRNVCWHLRRDLTILINGDVPLCQNCIFSNIIGNVFKDGLEKVWNTMNKELENHINKNYNEKCRNCDEYYTFNF